MSVNWPPERISTAKNTLCVANFILVLAFTSLGYDSGFQLSELISSPKLLFGLVLFLFSPVCWDAWLYYGLIEDYQGKPLISLRAFLWIGLFMAAIIPVGSVYILIVKMLDDKFVMLDLFFTLAGLLLMAKILSR